MKKTIFFLFSFLLFLEINAQEKQIPYPHLSPLQKIETKVVFHDPVIIGETVLEPGTYTIITKPNIDKWEIYFHTELDEYGIPETLDPNNILAKIMVPTSTVDQPVETFSIRFTNLKLNAVDLVISWVNIYVSIPIKIPTDQIINDRLSEERTVLASDYSTAAFILFDKQQQNTAALAAINEAILITENGKSFEEWLKNANYANRHLPNNYRLKSEILVALGERNKAIEAAKKSLKIAKKVKYDFYINENLKNLEKWNR